MQHYSLKLDAFRRSDNEREAMITDILRKYDKLLSEYQRKCDDYDNEVESRRMWQQKEALARNEVKQSRYAIVSGILVCAFRISVRFRQGRVSSLVTLMRPSPEPLSVDFRQLKPNWDATSHPLGILARVFLFPAWVTSDCLAVGVSTRLYTLAWPLSRLIAYRDGTPHADPFSRVRSLIHSYSSPLTETVPYSETNS